MKAIVRATYGPPEVLHLEEVPLPNVGDGDVLARVQAASANAGDWHVLRGTPLPFRLVAGLRKPKFKIIGNDIAGRVEAAGRNVTQFRPGDHVFGELSRCGFGAYSDFIPQLDEGAFLLQTVLPAEAALDEVDRLNHRVEDVLRQVPEVEDVVRRTGRAERTEDPMPQTGRTRSEYWSSPPKTDDGWYSDARFAPIVVLQLHGTEIERPLAVVMIGGLVTPTLFTLLVLPTFYLQVHGWLERRSSRVDEGAA